LFYEQLSSIFNIRMQNIIHFEKQKSPRERINDLSDF